MFWAGKVTGCNHTAVNPGKSLRAGQRTGQIPFVTIRIQRIRSPAGVDFPEEGVEKGKLGQSEGRREHDLGGQGGESILTEGEPRGLQERSPPWHGLG